MAKLAKKVKKMAAKPSGGAKSKGKKKWLN
jgi:hypothetical protein